MVPMKLLRGNYNTMKIYGELYEIQEWFSRTATQKLCFWLRLTCLAMKTLFEEGGEKKLSTLAISIAIKSSEDLVTLNKRL